MMKTVREIASASRVWTLVEHAGRFAIHYLADGESEPVEIPVPARVMDEFAGYVRAAQSPIPDYRQNVIPFRRQA